MSEKKANRNATPQPRRERQRGRILTEAGWNKLDAILQAWEVEQDCKRTFERIATEAQLDPGTVAKIFKRKEGADLGKLERLFETFQLKLEAADHRLIPQGMALIADPSFVGRTRAITDLNRLIDRDTKVIVIQARGGVGKTTLARKYLQQEFESILEFPIAKETKDIASIESLIEEKLRQLGEEPGREFFVSLDRLKRKLQAERIGILIDNLEPALDAAGKLIEPHRRYVELLRVLADPSVQAVTLITSRERLNEYSVSVQHYLLEELSLEAWNQFFQHRFAFFAADREISEADHTALTSLHKAYGGNAKAMDILCGAVLTDYSSSIEAYWQANQDDLLIERALEDLVVGQFDRLQQLDPDAYKLLCRMGCYRYQDVPTVPIDGLICLLWDVPENRHRRVVKFLQERSLVEFENSEYWLHPVIRAEAIGRLQLREDWKNVNYQIAEFYTNEVKNNETIEDAIKALEPYYHYIEIDKFEFACDVIVKERENKLLRSLTLGGSLFRLGLFQQLVSIGARLPTNLQTYEGLSIVCELLGATYLAIGDLYSSVKYYQILGRETRNSGIKNLEIISLQGLGFCAIYFGEIKEAIAFFEEATKCYEEIEPEDLLKEERSEFHFYYRNRRKYLGISYSCLALLNSLIESEKSQNAALGFAENAIHELSPSLLGYSSRKMHGLVFLGSAYKNLKNYSKACDLYEIAISCAEEHHFTQIKGMALIGLAEVSRSQDSLDAALRYHALAIEILDNLGAKCDLAEAFYQCGLTYQMMGETGKSGDNFQKAIRLFCEMEAPKQVERVRRSMESYK